MNKKNLTWLPWVFMNSTSSCVKVDILIDLTRCGGFKPRLQTYSSYFIKFFWYLLLWKYRIKSKECQFALFKYWSDCLRWNILSASPTRFTREIWLVINFHFVLMRQIFNKVMCQLTEDHCMLCKQNFQQLHWNTLGDYFIGKRIQ